MLQISSFSISISWLPAPLPVRVLVYIYSKPGQIKTWIQELNENEFIKPIQILRKYSEWPSFWSLPITQASREILSFKSHACIPKGSDVVTAAANSNSCRKHRNVRQLLTVWRGGAQAQHTHLMGTDLRSVADLVKCLSSKFPSNCVHVR